MHIIKNIILVFFCSLLIIKAQTQTPFISQNYNNPQFFNPASVGFGSYNRFSSIYRSQFNNVGRPYKTIGLNLDFGFLKNSGADMNNLGFGIQGVSEQILDGILQTNSITATIADRIFFDDFGINYLAIGVGATYINRTIDYSLLNFGDQFIQGKLVNSSSLDIIKIQLILVYCFRITMIFLFFKLELVHICLIEHKINKPTKILLKLILGRY